MCIIIECKFTVKFNVFLVHAHGRNARSPEVRPQVLDTRCIVVKCTTTPAMMTRASKRVERTVSKIDFFFVA